MRSRGRHCLHVGKMADADQTSMINKLRKLRKKLRQVETLQRLHGVRDLTNEEIAKVSCRDEIRAELTEMLANFSVDKQQVKSHENEASKLDNNCATTIVQEESQTQLEDVFEQKEADGGQANQDKDAVMESESESQEDSEKKNDGLAKQEFKHGANETDDKKVENIEKKKDSKRKVDHPKYWKEIKFSVRTIEGHHHPLCAVDFDEQCIISGGHDTSLKIWSANTYEELFSLGGHTGGISAALLISEDKAVTGSQDCSVMFWDVKSGKSLSSVYVYNPVSCLAYNSNGILAIGNDGGKVDIYSLEKEAITISSKVFDDPLVSLVFTDDGKLACASADGIVRTYELRNNELVQVADTYDNITSIVSFKNDANPADTPNTSLLNLPLRKINCIASFDDKIFWGDDGYNVKAYGLASGSVIKLRNNLTEYSPTDAMTVLKNGDNGYLFCAGFDIDKGSGYINVRKLPEMDYLGTISDAALGHISCIAASIVGGKIQLVTGGSELRIWNETSNGKKRRASDELADVIPCKFVRSYNVARDSEEEVSESETDVEDEEANMVPTENSEQRKSWCVLQ